MTTSRRRRIDRATAEQLLTGGPVRSTATDSGLVGLLAAAAAPPRPAELAGQDAALAAFRAASRRPTPAPGRIHMIKTALVDLFTVKIVAVAMSTVGAGGVALAASTGSLPGPVQNAAHNAFGAPAPKSARQAAATPSPDPTPSVTTQVTRGPGARPSAAAGPSGGTPSPSLTGLCKAYAAHPMTERGKALNSSAFTVLVNTAGGTDKVAAYCTELLAADSRGKADKTDPTRGPAGMGRPSDRPGNPHSSGNAPDKSGKPTDKPDAPGRPTDKPDRP